MQVARCAPRFGLQTIQARFKTTMKPDDLAETIEVAIRQADLPARVSITEGEILQRGREYDVSTGMFKPVENLLRLTVEGPPIGDLGLRQRMELDAAQALADSLKASSGVTFLPYGRSRYFKCPS